MNGSIGAHKAAIAAAWLLSILLLLLLILFSIDLMARWYQVRGMVGCLLILAVFVLLGRPLMEWRLGAIIHFDVSGVSGL